VRHAGNSFPKKFDLASFQETVGEDGHLVERFKVPLSIEYEDRQFLDGSQTTVERQPPDFRDHGMHHQEGDCYRQLIN
jgi:hypothetical protein